MQVGDLVWVVGRWRDAIPKHLAIIVGMREEGYYVVAPVHDMERRNLFMSYELRPYKKKE